MPTVYDLVQAASQLVLDLEEAEGELTPDSEALLDAFVSGSEDKIAGIRALLTRCKTEAEHLRAEEVRLRQRRQGIEAANRRVKGLGVQLLQAVEAVTGVPKVKTAGYSAWLSTSYYVEGPKRVDDWPKFAQRVSVEPDKRAMLEALKTGQAYAGFELVKYPVLQIR